MNDCNSIDFLNLSSKKISVYTFIKIEIVLFGKKEKIVHLLE